MATTTSNDPPKGFDRLLRAAFDAGIQAGARWSDISDVQAGEDAYAEWRQQWAGRPHEDQERAMENAGDPYATRHDGQDF